MTKLDQVTLSDEAARFVAEQVSAGRFRSTDAALDAAVGALRERDEIEGEWLAFARARFEQGRAAFARGDVLDTPVDELMDGIDAELGITR